MSSITPLSGQWREDSKADEPITSDESLTEGIAINNDVAAAADLVAKGAELAVSGVGKVADAIGLPGTEKAQIS